MSLQVWLPLNGDTHNQGLDGNYNFINSNTSFITVDNNGKIGKCLNFNSTANHNNIYSADNGFMSKYINNHSWSLCAWVQTTSSDTCVISLSYGLRMFAGSNAYISLYNSLRTVNCQSGKSTTDGKWHHLTATYSIDTNDINFYFDGLKVKTVAYTSGYIYASSWTNGLFIGKDPNNSTVSDHYLYKGKMNDVRIYNHCLSDKEVEEIAKGLVLHYKLDDPASIEKTTNLCNGATCGTQASAASPATWGGHKYYTVLEDTTANDPVPFQKKSVMTIDFNTSYGSGGGASVYPPTSFNIEPSTTYIYSRYIKPSDNFAYTHANFLYRYEYASGGGTRLVEGGVFNKTNTEYLGNGWYRCWGSFTSQATAATVTLPFYTYPGKSITYELGGIQLEKNTHMTPYIISSNTPIIIDSSGHNNNGIIVGTLTVSKNTFKYKYSTIFDGNTAAIQTPNLKTMITDRTYTISCWTYKTQIGSKNYQTIYGGPSGFELEARSSSTTNPLFRIHNWGGGTTPYEFGQWYHFCFVHTNDNSKLYINGELKITGTSVDIPSGNYFIGAWKTSSQQNYDGNISDFRIYATALTPEQILELYNTSATIDNKGNMYIRELVET